jgi:hypothetical protein
MKVTYANVMSTIAVFLAASTGGAYAAQQVVLKRDQVRSVHIKNGQVTLADLHPTVRKRLAAPSGTGGGGTNRPAAGSWVLGAQVGSYLSQQPIPMPRVSNGHTGGKPTLVRLRGTVTNVGTAPLESWLVQIRMKNGNQIDCSMRWPDHGTAPALQPGQTHNLNHCGQFGDIRLADLEGAAITGSGMNADLRIEYRVPA